MKNPRRCETCISEHCQYHKFNNKENNDNELPIVWKFTEHYGCYSHKECVGDEMFLPCIGNLDEVCPNHCSNFYNHDGDLDIICHGWRLKRNENMDIDTIRLCGLIETHVSDYGHEGDLNEL